MGRKKKPENEKATKGGVALDNDSRTILSKIMEWELAVHNNQFTASQAIRKCMRLAWQSHYEKNFAEYEAKEKLDHSDISLVNEQPGKGDPQPHLGEAKAVNSKITKGSESSGGGPSTATKNPSLKTG